MRILFSGAALRCRLAILFALILSGCSIITPKPPEDVRERLSKNYPVRTLTGFTEGLACMDQMLVARKVEPIYITAAPIPDYSENRGGAGYAARDMLISAIAEMTRESAAIRYVAFDRQTPDIVALQSVHPKKAALRIPDFFIRGAVTQINNAPYAKQIGDSVNLGKFGEEFQGGSIGNSASITLSSISLDMGMGLVNNYQMLPGVFSANTLSVEKQSSSDEFSISLKKIGAIYSVNENRAEALSMALRGLVEVGLIELFGKLYNVPYWECLAEIGGSSPGKDAARAAYAAMSPDDRATYVASQLIRQQLLPPGTEALQDGQYGVELRKALMQYRMRFNLFGGNEVDFTLFERLWKEERRAPAKLAAAGSTSDIGTSQRDAAPAGAAPAPSPVPAPPLPPATVEPSRPAPQAELIVGSRNTLRLISRERFPGNVASRVKFIALMAKANPEIFPDARHAADQRLPTGTRLRVPAEVSALSASATPLEGKAATPSISPASTPAPNAMKPAPAPDRPLLPAPAGR